jgi:hypothetical protein
LENHPFFKEDSLKNAASWGPKCGIIETNGGSPTFFVDSGAPKSSLKYRRSVEPVALFGH